MIYGHRHQQLREEWSNADRLAKSPPCCCRHPFDGLLPSTYLWKHDTESCTTVSYSPQGTYLARNLTFMVVNAASSAEGTLEWRPVHCRVISVVVDRHKRLASCGAGRRSATPVGSWHYRH